MAEYSRLAKGKFTSTGAAQVINLPFVPGYVELMNFTAANTNATSQLVPFARWHAAMGQGTAVIQGYNATPALIFDTVASNGFSSFTAGQLLQFGPTLTVTDITKAAAAQVTTSAAHNLASGDVVILEGLYQTTTSGMPQINGIPFTITRVDATNFTIPWNTNQGFYTIISGAATGTPRAKKVLYPSMYFPGSTVISAITAPDGGAIPTGTVKIDTASAHNFVVNQEVAFRIPTQWGSTELNSLPNTLTPGSPVYGFVVSVTDYNTVIVSTSAAASFTAFNSNQTIAASTGMTFPQIVAVGDLSSGGVSISSGSSLYPPPQSSPIGTTLVNTINGPGIKGAFVNNSAQGFVIGAGAGRVLTTASLVGAANDVIYWRAIEHDYVVLT